MVGADPQRQCAAHAEPDDHDVGGALRHSLVRRLGLACPVGPAGREHVVDNGAVPWQPRHLDVKAGRGERLGDAAHRRRVAGETVQHDGAVRAFAYVRPGLRPRDDRIGHGVDYGSAVRIQT